MLELITQVIYHYPALVSDFSNQQVSSFDVRPYMHVANCLSKNESLLVTDLPWAAESSDVASVQGIDVLETSSHDQSADQQAVAVMSEQAPPTQASALEDQEGLNIFIEEAEEHIEILHAFIEANETNDEVPEQVIRALHTLRGSAAMSHVDSVSQLAANLEEEFKRLIRMHEPVSSEHIGFLEQFV
ncbi:Hpt domain-containing protein, partial [Rhizobium hidalgonense]